MILRNSANNVNQPDILFACALKMTGYLRRYSLELFYKFFCSAKEVAKKIRSSGLGLCCLACAFYKPESINKQAGTVKAGTCQSKLRN